MRLSDDDLRQIDEAYLDGLSPEALREVSKRLCHDLKEARERPNQTPENSSSPPSTRAPWTETPSETEAEEHEEEQVAEGAKPMPRRNQRSRPRRSHRIRRASPVNSAARQGTVAPSTYR
jgi:transposase